MTRGYDAEKAAHASAYLLLKAPKGMEKVKLIKLLYLLERNSAAEHGQLMFYDQHFSAPEGPICTNALNGINGLRDARIWKAFVSRKGDHVSAGKDVKLGALDRLSEADRAIADALWAFFGGMSGPEIRNWTHDPANIPEYRDPLAEGATGRDGKPARKRIPITARDMAVGIGMDDPSDFADGIDEIRSLRASQPYG